jgi:predicted nucleic acid-binding protein
MLLDSNILIYGATAAYAVVDQILSRTDLAVASITRIETLGFHRLSAIEQSSLEAAFAEMLVIPLGDDIVERAIALRRKRRMALADAIIAATALHHELTLVTRNTLDFQQIDELKLLNSILNLTGGVQRPC